MEEIILNKIAILSKRYDTLSQRLHENGGLNDKDARELSSSSYQLKVLKAVLEESKERV